MIKGYMRRCLMSLIKKWRWKTQQEHFTTIVRKNVYYKLGSFYNVTKTQNSAANMKKGNFLK